MDLENILELAKKHPGVTITIKSGEVTSIAGSSEQKDGNKTDLITINDVAKFFNVTRSTIWRWVNKGYLIPVVISGRKRFRITDIEKLLKGVEND